MPLVDLLVEDDDGGDAVVGEDGGDEVREGSDLLMDNKSLTREFADRKIKSIRSCSPWGSSPNRGVQAGIG